MAHIKICKESGCQNAATTEGYCRLHYLRNWKRIRDEKRSRAAKKLNNYIEGVMRRHPDRYMEVIRKDLSSVDFERYPDEEDQLFGEPSYDEEIETLIKRLKVEKGY